MDRQTQKVDLKALWQSIDRDRVLKHARWAVPTLIFLVVIAWAYTIQSERGDIEEVMQLRDRAISQKDISLYGSLIADNYEVNGLGKSDMVAQMETLFGRFEKLDMSSHNREIRKLGDALASCEQSYTLKVMADGEWRQIVQRENLTLSRTGHRWSIISGL